MHEILETLYMHVVWYNFFFKSLFLTLNASLEEGLATLTGPNPIVKPRGIVAAHLTKFIWSMSWKKTQENVLIIAKIKKQMRTDNQLVALCDCMKPTCLYRNNCSVSDILVQGEISRQTYKYTSITGKSDQYRENKKDGQITR